MNLTPDAMSIGVQLVQVLGLAGLLLAVLVLTARC